MTIKRLTLLFSGIVTLFGPAWAQGDQKAKWEESLGAGDFKTRSATMMEIWARGKESLPFLNSLVTGKDPELAARALTIVRKVNLGITPETPEKIAKLIDQYLAGSARVKIEVIEKLLAANEYEILLRLRKMETDPAVNGRADEIIEEILPKLVRNALNEGQVDLAKEYLSLSQNFDHLIHYGHLLSQSGNLEKELKRLEQSDLVEDRARYLACLRVRGGTAKLKAVAEEFGDHDAAAIAALVGGNHVSYFESLLGHSNPTLSNRLYLEWSLASDRGDQVELKKTYESLLYLSEQKSEAHGARMALLKMGYGDDVLKNLSVSEFATRVDFHLGQERYEEARALIGVPTGDGFEKWLQDIGEEVKADLAKGGNRLDLDRLVSAVEFLEARGLVDEAVEGAYLIFDLVRSEEDLDISDFVARIYFSAPVSTYSAIAREIDLHDANLGEFLTRLTGNSEDHLWLDGLLSELYEEMPTRRRLLLTMSFSAPRLFVAPALFKEARDRVMAHVSAQDDRVSDLMNLLNLLVDRNREEDLLMITKALSDAGSPNHYLEAILAIDGGRKKEGGEAFAKLAADSSLASAEALYQRGIIFKHAGIGGGEELMKKGLLLSDGGVLSLRSFAMSHLRFGEVTESYRFLKLALLRSEAPTRSSQFGIRSSVINELAVQSAALGQWRDSLAYREAVALETNYSTMSLAVLVMRTRFHILVARGAVAMKEGEIQGAVSAFSSAHQLLPRDGYLANELFPLLRQLGLRELHDQLFAKSAEYYRENIRLFPKDDNLYNGFAWLASRANRRLDEAERYMKKALAMNPESAAYLDTMGEIFFARRNREKAVAWSTKSLQNEILGNERGRWELQEQHRRFQNGSFPPE